MSTLIKPRGSKAPVALPGPPWGVIAVFGFILTVVGIGQLALYIFPSMGFGSPEWEYGASAQLLGALPLATIGLSALYVAAWGSASRTGLIGVAALLVVMGFAVFSVLALFWSVVPMALKATPVQLRDPVHQTIARSTLSAVGFGVLYLWAAGLAVRKLKRSPQRQQDA